VVLRIVALVGVLMIKNCLSFTRNG
jgi:hypothetical protein